MKFEEPNIRYIINKLKTKKMNITFFEYENNCEELKILNKAVNENATRKELIQGQQLFYSIYQNIVTIEIKLAGIEGSIVERKFPNVGSVEKEILKVGELTITYEPKIERQLEINYQEKIEYYYGSIQMEIARIFRFLEPDFDHQMHEKRKLENEEKIKQGKLDSLTEIRYKAGRQSVGKSIEIVLKHYSEISSKLKEYIYLFIKLKN